MNDILLGLTAMHRMQYKYGTLTPDYVLVTKEKRACLSEIDFTKNTVSKNK